MLHRLAVDLQDGTDLCDQFDNDFQELEVLSSTYNSEGLQVLDEMMNLVKCVEELQKSVSIDLMENDTCNEDIQQNVFVDTVEGDCFDEELQESVYSDDIEHDITYIDEKLTSQ